MINNFVDTFMLKQTIAEKSLSPRKETKDERNVRWTKRKINETEDKRNVLSKIISAPIANTGLSA